MKDFDRVINICTSSNHKYVKYLYVMFLSLLERNPDETLHFFVLERDFSNDDMNNLSSLAEIYGAMITFVPIDEGIFEPIVKKGIGGYSVETLFRFCILDAIPKSIDKVLYLDVDILIRKSIRELYNTDFEGDLFVACMDMYMPMTEARKKQQGRTDGVYFNAGVMLWNLKQLRKEISINTFFEAALKMEGELVCADQEVLNYLFYDRVKLVDSFNYNYLVNMDNERGCNYNRYDPAIVHFAGCNPWKPGRRSEAYREWWDYVPHTPYEKEILSDYAQKCDVYLSEQWKRYDELEHIYQDLDQNYHNKHLLSCVYSDFTNVYERDDIKILYTNIVIYGAGKMGKKFLKLLRKYGYEQYIIAFVDKKSQGEVEGIAVYDDIMKFDDEKYCVVVTPANGNKVIIDSIKSQMGKCNHVVSLSDFLEENLFYSEMEDCCWETMSRENSSQIPGGDFESWCDSRPIVSNRIAFMSFPGFADHGKYIAIVLKNLSPDLELIFFTETDYSELYPDIRFVPKKNWKAVQYMMRTAKVCLFNSDIDIPKKDGQFFIETKHWSSVTLKKFFLDADTFQTEPEYYRRMKQGFECLDYIITGSEFDTRTCRSGFGFNGEVWQLGSPRSDVLLQREKYQREIREKYGLDENVKIMIYAPTYRFVKDGEHHIHESREIGLEYELVWNALKNRFGGEWVIMLRLHPTVAKESRNLQLPKFVVDASEYMDSGELVAACDGMISDYSSLMFEPSFIHLPVFLFATDREIYMQEYEFLIEYDELPYPIAENNTELVRNIELFDEKDYIKNVDEFLERYGVHEDGRASERAAKKILELINEKKV